MSNENLPIKVKDKPLAVQKRINKRRIEGVKKVGKIALSTGVAISGLAAYVTGGPIATVIGGTIFVGAFTKVGLEVISKRISNDSMFIIMKGKNKENIISQDAINIKGMQRMNGFGPMEKGAMMGLDLMVQLKNMQQHYEDLGISIEPAKNAESGLYPQVFTTLTHGINIKLVEALEKLGYLQIERKEPKRKRILFYEKVGFGQHKEAMQALLAKITGKGVEDKSVQMYELAIKLTDKQIDFEQIYQLYSEMKKSKEESPKANAARRIVSVFMALRKRNVDLETNEIGETVINHNAKEPFLRRIQREQNNSNKKYRDSAYIGDIKEQGPVQITESTKEDFTKQAIQDNETEYQK